MNSLRFQIDPQACSRSSRASRRLQFFIVLLVMLGSACSKPAVKDPDPIEKPVDTIEVDGELSDEPMEVAEDATTFVSRSDTLTGAFYRPEANGDTIGVLILHDWGPWGRDGIVKESFGLRLPIEMTIYRSIAQNLAENGLFAMTYDKRSCIEGSAPWCQYNRTYVEKQLGDLHAAFVEDAKHALDHLAQQPGVDPNRLAIVAHGHGSEIAMELSTDPRVVALALLVPSAQPPDQVALFQSRTSIDWLDRELKKGEDDRMKDVMRAQKKKIANELRAQKTTFAALRNGNKVEVAFGLSGAVWKQLFDAHTTFWERLATTDKKTVIVTGGRVSNTPVEAAKFEATAQSNDAVTHIHLDALCQLLVSLETGSDGVIPDPVIEAILSVATAPSP